MKEHVHFFSQKDVIKKGVELETLGQRGRQANEFAELGFPILPGFIIDSVVASHLAKENVLDAIRAPIKKADAVVEKSYGNPNEPLLIKIVISPNLAISNYPALHNFGLARKTVGGFTRFVGENFAAHEVAFLARGMLKIEE
nr:pyruvate, phosphate dikinase [Spirochaetia bacterium]